MTPTGGLHRFKRFLPFLASPRDGSSLEYDEDTRQLFDGKGRIYPVVRGLPLLVPHLMDFFHNHYEGMRHSGTHPALQGSADDLINHLAADTLEVYCMGFIIRISAVDVLQMRVPPMAAGTLFETEDGKPAIHLAREVVVITDMEARGKHDYAGNWRTTRRLLRLDPPYFLTADRFPHDLMLLYFEVLNAWIADDVRAALDSEDELPQETSEMTQDGRAEQLNSDFFHYMFNVFRLDRSSGGFLDAACAGGALVRAFDLAGAEYPLGADLRVRPQRLAPYPTSSRLSFVLADVGHWCFAPDAFTLICLRNYAPICKVNDLAHYDDLMHNILGSLSAEGIAYVTVFTDGTGELDATGLTHHRTPTLLDWVERNGAVVLKLMRLGSMTGMVLCNGRERSWFTDLERTAARAQRREAYREFKEQGLAGGLRVLGNYFLAIVDFVSEIALESRRRNSPGVCLVGTGLLAYYVWQMLKVGFPEVEILGFVTDSEGDPSAVAAEVASVYRAPEAWWDALKVGVDEHIYEDLLRREPLQDIHPDFTPDLLFFHADTEIRPLIGDRFHYSSGDYDVEMPREVCRAALQGPLRCLGPQANFEEAVTFGARFRYLFPFGWM